MRSKLILFSLICLFAAIFVIAAKVEAQRLEAQKIEAQRLEVQRTDVQRTDVQRTETPGYEIRLKSRRFTPPEDLMSAIQSHIHPSPHERVHVLMQFHDIPDSAQRGILKAAGVKLLNYIPHKAWFVSVPRGLIEAQLRGANVRWIGPILPEDKIFPPILNRGVASWAVNADGSVNLEISFFKDVPLIDARNLMLGMGGVVKEESTVSNRLTVTISPDKLMDIAKEDTVRWIIEERPPKIPLNDGSRANVGVDTVQTSPYNLSGRDVDVGIWDAGDVDSTHDDFGTRVTIVDYAGVENHTTHVAGTMGGDGTRSQSEGGDYAYQWKGMAPQMDIISYDWDDNIDEHGGAISTYGIEISQNSWGYDFKGPTQYYGYYGYDAPEYDDIVTGRYNKRISVVFAAGNDRDIVTGEYDSIGPPSTAKNIICVGAINSDDNSMTSFSSWGPMDDGRIKPDVVAPGDEVGGDGGIKSTFPGSTYGVYYGTSMAAPCVSGCASLIIQDYRSLYAGVDPLPSTAKALLLHEAKDLGNIGPDYSYGYGDIQIQKSIDKLRTKSLVEDDISHNNLDTYSFYVPEGSTKVKITLVWDDEPATEGAAISLVNDLDLIVTDPNNVRCYPLTLNPGSPSLPAVKTQEDHTNNVEQVEVSGGITPGNWTIKVFGKNVPYAPQRYSLIFTPNYGANVIGKIYKDSGYSQEEKFFDRTETVYIEAYITSGGSPLTGATVTADLKLSNGTTVATINLVDVGGGYYRNSWNSSGANPDVYLVDINVADPPLNTKEYLHLYPQTGVSSYRLDYDEDSNNDYVLENKHLVAVYDGRSDTDKSLLYLSQKDTDFAYSFAGISDTNSIGRGEITTSNMKKIRFSSFSLDNGENLASSTFGVITNLTKELFSDGFESGDFITGGWSLDSPPPVIGTEDVYEGIYSAGKKVYSGYGGKYHRMWRTVDTTGCTDITFSYARAVEDKGSGTVTFTAEYSTNAGATWNVLETVTNTNDVFTYVSWPLPAEAENNPNFVIRFGGIFGGATSNSANDWWVDDVKVTSAEVGSKVETQFNITIQMKSEDVDYLVYKLSGFDANIDNINDMFSPISGSLGSSVEDDRYHFGNGTDDFVNNLFPVETWTDFSTLTDQERYVAIYDDSLDGVNNNVISWVCFPNINTVSFQDVGCWYKAGKEGLRIRYDTTSALTTDQAEYILAFTRGSYSVIDQWMPGIASGQYPPINFMTPSLYDVDIPLQAGWNLIALPVTPSTPYTASTLIDEINSQGGTAQEVDRWYEAGWSGHIGGLPFNDFNIDTGKGYFVRCNSPNTWTVTGTELNITSIPLDTGWTLISLPNPGYLAQTLIDDINSQGGIAQEVDRWYNAGWDGHIDGLPFNNFDIEVGKGYFVRCNSASIFNPQ